MGHQPCVQPHCLARHTSQLHHCNHGVVYTASVKCHPSCTWWLFGYARRGGGHSLGLIPGLGRSPAEGNGNPLQYSCPEISMNRGAWWATVHEVSESDTTEHTYNQQSVSYDHCFINMFQPRLMANVKQVVFRATKHLLVPLRLLLSRFRRVRLCVTP